MGASALLALIVAAAGSPPAAGETTPFSLTLQGAASLGTYEAAVNWTLIRLIRSDRLDEDTHRGRRPRLEALSGSSAGSVNALLAAALWCEADDEVDNLSVDRNLLRDAWLAIGLDELLPGDPALYTPSDGLLAASAFTPVVDSVQSRVFSGKGIRFKPGCRVPVGFTMTRVVPQLRTVSGLRVKSQQTVVPLIFEVDYKKMVGKGETTKDVLLQEGDIVYVPPTVLAQLAMVLEEFISPVARAFYGYYLVQNPPGGNQGYSPYGGSFGGRY